MHQGEISIMEALNQIQSWLNAGELDNVIQGCQEILEIEPGNVRALSMLKQAKQLRLDREMLKEEKPAEAPQAPSVENLENLQVETTPEPPKVEENHFQSYQTPKINRTKMFLAMAVPAAVVVIVGGLIIMAVSNLNRESNLNPVEEPAQTEDFEINNEQRSSDLTQMAEAIEAYHEANERYPSLRGINKVIEMELGSIPTDPQAGNIDAAGNEYGYVYAIYDIGPNGVGNYILSALFEDSDGTAHAWTHGTSTKDHEDYRDTSKIHVSLIGE